MCFILPTYLFTHALNYFDPCAHISDENLAYWKEGDKEGMMNLGKDTFTKEELKEALKKFKANRDDVQNPDAVKNKYRYTLQTSFDLIGNLIFI